MDISFLLLLQGFRAATGGMFDGFFLSLSSLCTGAVTFLVPAAVLWCIDKEAGTYICFNFSIGYAVNQIVKNTCCVYRPWIRDARVLPVTEAVPQATGYSFPSGHCAIATSEYGSLAVSYRKKKWLVAICAVLIALIGFSRNYLGVHTPQDVIAGIGLGCIVLYADWKLLHWAEAAPGRDKWVFIGCLVAAIGLLLYEQFKPYPMDYENGKLLVDPFNMITDCYMASGCLAGYATAWYLERRLVSFSVDGSVPCRVARLAAGSLIMAVIFLFAMPWLLRTLGTHMGMFVACAIAMLFTGFVYPALFMWVRRLRARRSATPRI